MARSGACRAFEAEEGSYPNSDFSAHGWVRPNRRRDRLAAEGILSNASTSAIYSCGFPAREQSNIGSIWERVSQSVAQISAPAPNAEAIQFTKLAAQWKKETALYSNLSKKVMHPAYQAIIGMGASAIPYILMEMKERPGHWFWALDFVTYSLTQGKSPAENASTFDEATRLWLQWGERNGFI